MNARLEQVSSVALTIAAVAMAVAIVRGEFVREQGRQPKAVGTFVYDSSWRAMIPYAVQTGDTAAPIQLVEFVDLECPVCRGFHRLTIGEARKKYGARVSLSFVHFPLTMHRFARVSAQAAECAERQGRFSEFLDAVYEKQDSLGLKSWGSYAQNATVPDTGKFSKCVASGGPFARIDSGIALARRKKVAGTPTVFVNGWRFPTPPTPEELSAAVDAILAGRSPKY